MKLKIAVVLGALIISKEYPVAWMAVTNQEKQIAHNLLFEDRIPLQFPAPAHLGETQITAPVLSEAESNDDASPAILVTMAPRSAY